MSTFPTSLPNTSVNRATTGRVRWSFAAWLFREQTMHSLEFLLDEAFRIPGTQLRFGIDGIIGLVPGLGDVLAAVLSILIPLAGWMRGLPYVTLIRMGVNLSIGVLVGSIPLFGDIFVIAWKANRRNYRLLQLHIRQPRCHTWRDWAFLAAMIFGLLLIFAIPMTLAAWLLLWLFRR